MPGVYVIYEANDTRIKLQEYSSPKASQRFKTWRQARGWLWHNYPDYDRSCAIERNGRLTETYQERLT